MPMKGPYRPVDVHPGVYPPGEDTYILQDTIDVDAQDIVLDMGCGSGYISLNLLNHVKRVVALDIHLGAVHNTYENLRKHDAFHKACVVQSDLFAALSPHSKFSLITFNPPYLPKDDNETSYDSALVGGEKGIEVSERFIKDCSKYMMPRSRVYLVASSLADVKSLIEIMEMSGLETDIVAEEGLFFEKLFVIRGIYQRK